MTTRLNYFELVPGAMDILMTQESYLKTQFENSDTLSVALLELIKLRVSQINQCAFCINMHSKDAMAQGESAERIIGLSAWRGMPLYSEVERSALLWAELLTVEQHVSETDFESARKWLPEKDLVNLTIAVNAINSWNRMSRAFSPSISK